MDKIKKLFSMEDLERVARLANSLFEWRNLFTKDSVNLGELFRLTDALTDALHEVCGLNGWTQSDELRALVGLVQDALDIPDGQEADALEAEA